MPEMYVEIVAGASRFADKCAMNKATEKVRLRSNVAAGMIMIVKLVEFFSLKCSKKTKPNLSNSKCKQPSVKKAC